LVDVREVTYNSVDENLECHHSNEKLLSGIVALFIMLYSGF